LMGACRGGAVIRVWAFVHPFHAGRSLRRQ
jgi:hypothetical protein